MFDRIRNLDRSLAVADAVVYGSLVMSVIHFISWLLA